MKYRPGVPNHLSAQDLAHLYRTTVGYVRKLASKQGWRRVRVGRSVRYHVDDADDGLRKSSR